MLHVLLLLFLMTASVAITAATTTTTITTTITTTNHRDDLFQSGYITPGFKRFQTIFIVSVITT